MGACHMAERHFGDRRAMTKEGGKQVRMFGRIDPVVAAGEHSHRAAFDRGAMRGLVDAACQAGSNHKTGVSEIARQHLRKLQSGRRGIARTDDRNYRPHQHVADATDAKQRRRVVEFRKPRRIAIFAGCDQANAEFGAGFQLGAGILLAANALRPRCAAAPGQIRQPFECGPRAAEMTEQ